MLTEDVGHFLVMLPTYVRAMFGDAGFVQLKRSDDDDFLLNIEISINVNGMTSEDYVEKEKFLEDYFIYDESRHSLDVLSKMNINFERIGEYGGKL